MKGVVLAGGLGTRMGDLTRITNKHLLPVYDRPMIYYPIQYLVEAGIKDIMVVTGGEHAGDFLRLLRNGDQFGCRLHYAYQEGNTGIAAALGLARAFAEKDSLCVLLGDNLFEGGISAYVANFGHRSASRVTVILAASPTLERFGVPVMKDGRIIHIEEKPAKPQSSYAITGCYLYSTSALFNVIEELKPSLRGELEITDLNNRFVDNGCCTHFIHNGWWIDCGTPESLLRASNLVKKQNENKPNTLSSLRQTIQA